MQRSDFIATWQLESWHNHHSDGKVDHPFGADAIGTICYTDEGFVHVNIMANHRANFDQNDPFKASMAEDSAAMKTQISYSGTYDYEDGTIYHNVKIASCPNWTGSQQIRNARMIGDTLELSATGAQFQGNTVTAKLIWRRAVAR
jgi:hypothetical protein